MEPEGEIDRRVMAVMLGEDDTGEPIPDKEWAEWLYRLRAESAGYWHGTTGLLHERSGGGDGQWAKLVALDELRNGPRNPDSLGDSCVNPFKPDLDRPGRQRGRYLECPECGIRNCHEGSPATEQDRKEWAEYHYEDEDCPAYLFYEDDEVTCHSCGLQLTVRLDGDDAYLADDEKGAEDRGQGKCSCGWSPGNLCRWDCEEKN